MRRVQSSESRTIPFCQEISQRITDGRTGVRLQETVLSCGVGLEKEPSLGGVVTDPAVIAAFAHLVADDEQLGYVPTDLIPEV